MINKESPSFIVIVIWAALWIQIRGSILPVLHVFIMHLQPLTEATAAVVRGGHGFNSLFFN